MPDFDPFDPNEPRPLDEHQREREDPFAELPVIEDPDAGSLPPPGTPPAPGLDSLDGEVASMKAADAPLEPPDIGAPDTSSLPGKSFGADIAAMKSADTKPGPTRGEPGFVKPPRYKAPAQPPHAGGRDHDAAVPTNYEEFQQAVAGLKRTDGRPWDSRAVANLYRRYRELGQDNGLEPPAGLEAADLHQREGEQGFVQAERTMVHAQTDLFRLLTGASIDHSRTLTQLRNLLIRNRH